MWTRLSDHTLYWCFISLVREMGGEFLSPLLLGSEARKALQVFVQNNDWSGRCWIKTFNIVEAPRIDDLIIHSMWSYHLVYNKIHTYLDHLKEFFNRSSVRPLAVSTQSPDDRISSWTLVTTRGREEGGEVPLGLHGHIYYGRSPPIYRLWECEIFTKNPYYYVYIHRRPLTLCVWPSRSIYLAS